jgi:hypothetical protein
LDFDAATIATIRAVQPYTMTSPARLFALCSAVRHLASHDVPGDIVECGVWRGGSMMAAARTLLEEGDATRHFHLFDTFEGMVEPGVADRRWDDVGAETLLEDRRDGNESLVWARAGLPDVQAAMRSVGYPQERIHYVVGPVEQTLPTHAPERIGLLRLDTDWYESTRHELVHLFPRISPHGVLIIDDYGYWKGARQAVDEYLDGSRVPIMLQRIDYTGRIAVVPPSSGAPSRWRFSRMRRRRNR